MRLKDLSFANPLENIVFDEVLLSLAESGQEDEALRFWESQQTFIVLGKTGRLEEEILAEACRRDRVPVLRRGSGGGTVVQGPGCLNYALILSRARAPALAEIRSSYQYILGKISAAFKAKGVSVSLQGLCDLAWDRNDRKISGNAQKRGRRYILHHGTILYRFDVSVVEKYLPYPPAVPLYRKGRTHSDFLTNVPMTCAQIKKSIRDAFEAKMKSPILTPQEQHCLGEMLSQSSLNVLF